MPPRWRSRAPRTPRAPMWPRAGAAPWRSRRILELHELCVRHPDVLEVAERASPGGHQRGAHRPSVAHHQRRALHRAQRVAHAPHVLDERLAAGKAKAGIAAAPCRPRLRLLALDVAQEAPPPLAAVGLREAVVHHRLETQPLAHDLRRLESPRELRRVERGHPESRRVLREGARLLAAALVQRGVDRPLHPALGVVGGLAMACQVDHASGPWNSFNVSARRPTRSVSSEITSAGSTFPRFTAGPKCRMNQTCWCFCGASKMSLAAGISWTISSIRPSRGSSFGR